MGLLQLVLWITGLDVVWCNLIALCFSGLFNFTMSDRVIFRKKKTIFPDASLDRTGNPAADSEA